MARRDAYEHPRVFGPQTALVLFGGRQVVTTLRGDLPHNVRLAAQRVDTHSRTVR